MDQSTRTIDRDPMSIDVDRVVHVVPPCHKALYGGDVDGRVREDALRVEGDHLDLRPRLRQLREVAEDREARLAADAHAQWETRARSAKGN